MQVLLKMDSSTSSLKTGSVFAASCTLETKARMPLMQQVEDWYNSEQLSDREFKWAYNDEVLHNFVK